MIIRATKSTAPGVTKGSEVYSDRHRNRPIALNPQALGLFFDYPEESSVEIIDGIATVCVEGPIEHKCGWWFDSYEAIAGRFHEALTDENVRAVILKIDSPGGECSGLIETVRALRALKESIGKPVYAYADESAYSAAYALATIADEIYLPPSAGVGSIGVIHTMCDRVGMNDQLGVNVAVVTSGEQKADGHPDVALSKGALSRAQKRVDGLAALFFQSVSEARGMPPEAVAALEAGSFYGADAVTAGLADGVISFADLVNTARSIANAQTSVEKPMSRVLIATQKLNTARATLTSAKTEADKAAAAALVRTAEGELAEAEVKIEVSNTETTVEAAEDEEYGDGEEDTEDDEEDGDEEDDKEDDDKAAAADTARATPKDVLALCKSITGKTSAAEMLGALQAMAHAHKEVVELRAKVTKLERSERSAVVDKLVTRAIKDGKVTPALKSWATDLGRKNLKSLRAYIEASPSKVVAIDGGAKDTGLAGANPACVPNETELKIAKTMGISAEKLAETKKQIAATAKTGASGLIVH